MRTIEIILENNNTTLIELKKLEKLGLINGCGGKGGFNFSDKLEKLPFFKGNKKKKLLKDLRTICGIHDKMFFEGKGFTDFIKANYLLAQNTIILLHWTTSWKRILIFISVFGGTTLFGWKYFNNK